MSKDLEEIKSIVAIHFGALGFLNPSENEQILKDRDKVLNALQRLESIDNAIPSEALESLKRIKNIQVCIDYEKDIIKSVNEMLPNSCDKVEQSLIKSQEQEKVLKILKERQVNIALLVTVRDVEEYNFYIPYEEFEKYLTQEEFDLLKRWIGC